MTAFKKPRVSIDDQLLKQQMFAQEGNLAVPVAQERQLDRALAGKEMSKQLKLEELGMKKKQMDAEIELGKGYLELGKQKLAMQKDQFHFNLMQDRKAVNVAKWGAALQLSFGIGNFMQDLKLQRKNESLLTKLLLQQDEIKRKRKEEENA